MGTDRVTRRVSYSPNRLLWLASSLLSLLNKYIIYPSFPYPTLTLALSLVGVQCTSQLWARFGSSRMHGKSPLPSSLEWSDYQRSVLPGGLLLSWSLLSSHMAQRSLSATSMHQMMIVMPFIILFIGYGFARKSVSMMQCLSVTLLMIGSLVFIHKRFQASFYGFFWQASSLVTLYLAIVQIKKGASKMDPVQFLDAFLFTCTGAMVLQFLVFEFPIMPWNAFLNLKPLSMIANMTLLYVTAQMSAEVVTRHSLLQCSVDLVYYVFAVSFLEKMLDVIFFDICHVLGATMVLISMQMNQKDKAKSDHFVKGSVSNRKMKRLLVMALVFLFMAMRVFRKQIVAPLLSGHVDSSDRDPCAHLEPSLYEMHVKNFTRSSFVLVTGGSGFIGSRLVKKLLAHGYRVRVLENLESGHYRNLQVDNYYYEHVIGDLGNSELYDKLLLDVETVLHLALPLPTESRDNTLEYLERASKGHWAFFNATRAKFVNRIILLSSAEVYGMHQIPFSEDSIAQPETAFGVAALGIENQLRLFSGYFGTPSLILRAFSVYGDHEPEYGPSASVTGVFKQNAFYNEAAIIYGDGSQTRDFIHVNDVVRGLMLSLQNYALHGKIINLGSGQAYTIKEVANMASHSIIHQQEQIPNIQHSLANTCKMKSLIGLRPHYDFKTEYPKSIRKRKRDFYEDSHKWIKNFRMVEAPWLLKERNPMGPFATGNSDLKNILTTITKSQNTTQKTVTIMVFDPKQIALLQNTFYSMMTYGGILGSILLIATDRDAFHRCLNLNFACHFEPFYYSEVWVSSKVALDILLLGYNVHFSERDVVYLRNVYHSYEQVMAQSDADMIFQIEKNSVASSSFYIIPKKRTISFVRRMEGLSKKYPSWAIRDIVAQLRQDYWEDCIDKEECSAIKSNITRMYRHHSVFHCAPRPMHDFEPCLVERILFVQALCSHTIESKMALLREYGLWLMTDCSTPGSTCERAPEPWISRRSRRSLECHDRIANLSWQSGKKITWDYMRGSLWDEEAFSQLTHGEPMIALVETANTTHVVSL